MRIKTVLLMLELIVLCACQSTAQHSARDTATFAGGCFWCMEPPFEKLKGVVSVIAGYTGGSEKNPTYEEVSAGKTGHAEAVQIVFNPTTISYKKLLDVFWHNIDPTATDRQFCDIGTQYRSGIFYRSAVQKKLAEESKRRLDGIFKKPVFTEITSLAIFYPAEQYHQDFHKKNPTRYTSYRSGCGRDRRLKELWGDTAASHN